MGIYARLINHDQLLRGSSTPVTVVNLEPNLTAEQKLQINQTLYTTNGDVYNNVPSCQCRELKGNWRIGVICPNCQTPVKETVEETLEPYVYIATPQHVASLINPKIWMLLRLHFQKDSGRFDLIRYLTDSYYEPEVKTSQAVTTILNKLELVGLNVRNYNHFVERFQAYMDFLFDLPEYKKKASAPRSELYDVIMNNLDCVFSNYIPVLNKTLLVMESTNAGNYIDAQITKMIDAVRLVTGIDAPGALDLKPIARQSRVSRMLTLLSEFYFETYKDLFCPKPGLIRRHVFGTRVDYSFRAVVSSITEPHDYDEVHIPWSVACNVFKYHIANYLDKENWTPHQIQHFLNKYAMEYHPKLDEIFQRLIRESRCGDHVGIPVFSNRNPSLLRGSIKRDRLTKVKTDVCDLTISISGLTTAAQNADFDGDELNFLLPLDNYSAERAHFLATEMNIFDLDAVNSPQAILNLTKPVAQTAANWLEAVEPIDPVKLERMHAFLA